MRLWLECFAVLFLGMALCGGVRGLKTNGNLAERASLVDARDATKARGDLVSVVDGQRAGPEAGQCFALSGANLALHVHLVTTANVSFLLLYTKAEGEESVQGLLSGLKVYVGAKGQEEQVCTTEVRVGQQDKMARVEVICDAPVTGSRITLRLPGRRRTLRLCEVEVYDTTCDCLDRCEEEQGFCFGPCVRNDRCRRKNAAIFQEADSSALITSSGPPSVVVNGNTGTIFVSRKVTEDVRGQNCIVSQSTDASLTLQPQNTSLTSRKKRMTLSSNYVTPWWSVDLGEVVAVQGVVIYRANAEQVWADESLTKITVDGETCAKYGPETLSRDEALIPRLVVTCDHAIRGQKVKVSRVRVSRTVEPTPLKLCELQVWSCMAGWHGDQCQYRCGRCHEGRDVCDTVTGHCPDNCMAGWFGETCKKRCNIDCLGGQCAQDTGQCLQCPPNRVLPFCTELSTTSTTSTTTTTTATTTSTTASSNGNANDTRADDNKDDDDDNDVGATVGAVVGSTAAIVVVFVVFFVCYRRRRGRLTTKEQSATIPTVSGKPEAATCTDKPEAATCTDKPEAAKTESFSYMDAMSSSVSNVRAPTKPDVTNDVTADGATYDIIGENCYEALDLSQYASLEGGGEDHVYIQPVFLRKASQTSTASGPYVNLEPSGSSIQ